MTAKRASRGKSTAITKASATAINLAQLERQIAVLVKTGDLEGLSDLHAKAQGVEAYFRARMPEREAGLQHQEHAARAVLLIERGLGDALAKRP
ncbi:MAG TPA: hypothetical protein VFT98_03585, partial [Myxococcota bacterium]|nr:hypothetical protein [Myxococcota bacterium]